jgi:hypothetical protein
VPGGPSLEGSVVIDIGGSVGALLVYTDEAVLGLEIEVTPTDVGGPPTHTAVRERQLPLGSRFAAVFPALPAGTYRLPSVGSAPSRDVTVRPARVTEVNLNPKEAVNA